MRRPSLICAALLLVACGDRARTDENPPAARVEPPRARAGAPASTPVAAAPAAPLLRVVPVQVGGEEDLDACGGGGMITPKGGSTFVQVRSGPGERHPVVDSLRAGEIVSDCDTQEDWAGIVYSAPGTDTDCGVGTPIAARGPYTGPCRSGWIPPGTDSIVAG